MKIFEILNELNSSNSSNYKKEVLLKYKDNDELKSVFKYAYDKIDYTYGVTSRTIQEFSVEQAEKMWEEKLTFTYPRMFELLERLSKREFTGHKALAVCKYFAMHNEQERVELFYKIIDRDLKVNVSEKTINKIWKNLIPKPNYNRCDVFNAKTASKIKFPAFIQLKCDGTYREINVNNTNITIKTRSGEISENPILAEQMKDFPNGYYTGEFTIGKATEPNLNRSEGNGLINSDNPPYKEIIFTVWDFLTEDEYSLKVKTTYKERFEKLSAILSNNPAENVQIVPCKIVNSSDEALKVTSEFMNQGLEGGVLKDMNMTFKNGTSKQQLKIKLKVDADLRVTGFIKGAVGTKYENLNKVITYATDDGKIKGQCSGMTDAMCEEVTKNPEKYIGKIVAVQFNDLIRAEGHEYYALSHPRFQEFRTDKTNTDSFERILELRDMAKTLS